VTVASGLRLVAAEEVDAGAVAALVNQAYSRYRHLFAGQRTTPEELLEEAGPGARFILAEDEAGRLIGSALLARAERFVEPDMLGPSGTPRPAVTEIPADHPWRGALYFGMAAVEDSWTNRGIGRRMVAFAEEVARAEGYRAVALGTVREFGLVPYYEKLGYRVIHEAGHPAGHWDFLVPHRYCEMVKPV
jgi:GNAT superfamily N-acetyltransferase